MTHQITVNNIPHDYMTQIINSVSKIITLNQDLSDYSVNIGDHSILVFSDSTPVTINFDAVPTKRSDFSRGYFKTTKS